MEEFSYLANAIGKIIDKEKFQKEVMIENNNREESLKVRVEDIPIAFENTHRTSYKRDRKKCKLSLNLLKLFLMGMKK